MGLIINPYLFSSFPNLYSNSLDAVNEYVNCGDRDEFSFGATGATENPFSLSGWVKATTLDANIRILMTKYHSNVATEYFLFLFSGGIRFHLTDTIGSNWIGRNTNNNIMAVNIWYFWVATYSGGKTMGSCKIYLGTEGAAATQVDTTNSANGVYTRMINTTKNLTIGGAHDGGFLFSGKHFGNAIWNKELTLAEVNEIRTLKGGDLRTVSCNANLIEAWSYPNGQAGFPTLTGYKNGYNGTMILQENTDITTDIPT